MVNVTDTTSVSSDDEERSSKEVAVIGVLVGLIVVLACLFLAMTLPPLLRYIRRKREIPKKTIDSRYDTIEGWLITKRARPHSQECKDCCSDGERERRIKSSTSYDTADTSDDSVVDAQECPICLTEIQPDDIVSWSPNWKKNCNHAFHHHCIKEWLVRHANCPFCREIFLPVDNPDNQQTTPVLKRLSMERQRREALTYFCAESGLVTLSTRSEQLTASNVTLDELACMRQQDDLESRASSTDSAQYRLELEDVVASTIVLASSDSVDIVIDIGGSLQRQQGDAEEDSSSLDS